MPEPAANAGTSAYALSAAARAFLDSPQRYGVLATINPDGTPHQAVVWYRLDDDDSVLINSRVGRRWPANLLRDPRCSLTAESGLDYVVVRGTAAPSGEGDVAQRDIADLAVKYDGPEEAARLVAVRFSAQERISFRIRIHGSYEHMEG
ncbi:MAG: TIGR03618 family F420-dependent PPOX class oxidoreductase [Candidatus Limnocylindrales bacterium]